MLLIEWREDAALIVDAFVHLADEPLVDKWPRLGEKPEILAGRLIEASRLVTAVDENRVAEARCLQEPRARQGRVRGDCGAVGKD